METKSTGGVKKKTSAEQLREKKINAYLEQITQLEELVNLLSGEKAALIHENMVGLPVSHKQFGSGQVASQDALTVFVRFANDTRRFPIPNAFLDGFLHTEDAAVSQRLARHRDIEKQIAESKKEISAADRAIQLLKK